MIRRAQELVAADSANDIRVGSRGSLEGRKTRMLSEIQPHHGAADGNQARHLNADAPSELLVDVVLQPARFDTHLAELPGHLGA
jgi:hypothetical protein